MRMYNLWLWLAFLIASACVARSLEPAQRPLSEAETLNLIDNPEKWDGRTVTIRIYPFDRGSPTSYAVCFDRCDETHANRSPFVIITQENRFAGYKGDKAAIVTAVYSSSCFYKGAIYAATHCADFKYGVFTEKQSSGLS